MPDFRIIKKIRRNIGTIQKMGMKAEIRIETRWTPHECLSIEYEASARRVLAFYDKRPLTVISHLAQKYRNVVSHLL